MSAIERHTVGGAKPETGHYEEFLANPSRFLLRAWRECGPLADFDLGGTPHTLVVGSEGQETIFRAPDDVLSTSDAYQYMVPVFGEGIQYGAPLERERQQVRFQANALKPDKMRGYAQVIAEEVEAFVRNWEPAGERDFYETFKELVLRTSTHCLMGRAFRENLTDEFGRLFADLEHAISPQAVVDAHSESEVFEKRDVARARLQDLLMETVRERRRRTEAGEREPDMLQTFLDARYADGSPLPDAHIPGMIVWIMFAGFHTSSNTASWVAVELARNGAYQAEIAEEVDAIYQGGGDLSFAALREIPKLEAFTHETLRLHPPLITLARVVREPIEVLGHTFPPGHVLMVSPYVAHRVPKHFPDPERFDPRRPEPAEVFASIPFGGGKRKCVGNAFALLQVKSIFVALLRRYALACVDPPESYVDIMPSLILRPSEPCNLRYTARRA
ncbi:MAG: cytochrome P450 [Myxococcota bacterium]